MIRDLATGEPVDDLRSALLAEDRTSVRPWVMINIVTSIDGATAVDGGSTPLSDDDDRALFQTLRGISDVIVVGSGTVKAEDYRPDPRLVIVSGRLSLEPDMKVFAEPDSRPTLVGSTDADPSRVARMKEVSEVILLDNISGANVVGQFPAGSIVLCEGGPTLNACLFADDVVDEIHWTVAPVVVAGQSKRMTAGDAVSPPPEFRLDRTWKGERSLFLRYNRAG